MYVIVIGCGSSGSYLANILSARDEDVVVIDQNEQSFKNLSDEFTGFTLVGDGTDLEVLKLAKIEQADLVVVTTDIDNVNAMVAQIAKTIFAVSDVLVRVIDPAKEKFYADLSVHIFSPIRLLVEKFEETIYHVKGGVWSEGSISRWK